MQVERCRSLADLVAVDESTGVRLTGHVFTDGFCVHESARDVIYGVEYMRGHCCLVTEGIHSAARECQITLFGAEIVVNASC